MEEPWEDLDVDDSDIPVLRPCKRSKSLSSQPKPSSPPAPSIIIPGPAGAVQAAMNRKARNDHASSDAWDDDPIPTQDYIKRVLENGNVHGDDDDFTTNPWLSSLDFVRTGVNSISSIKNGINTDRVARVVAIIKSCTRTGLGDLMVTLKDRTGTMGASIHRKVLSDGEFASSISVGAVLVLQKVAVFSPSRSAYYLNITLNNVVKVISKDSESPSKHSFPASSARYAVEGVESNKVSNLSQPTMGCVRTEGIMSSLRKSSEVRGSTKNYRVIEENAIPGSSCFSNENFRKESAGVGKESSFMKQVKDYEVTKMAVTEGTTGEDHVIVTDMQPSLCKLADRDNSTCFSEISNTTENLVELSDEQVTEKASGIENQKQQLVSKTSLLEWTDEQLDELSAFQVDDW
ncbi:hypothetical protein UlMin_008901 [Ulmus minor]